MEYRCHSYGNPSSSPWASFVKKGLSCVHIKEVFKENVLYTVYMIVIRRQAPPPFLSFRGLGTSSKRPQVNEWLVNVTSKFLNRTTKQKNRNRIQVSSKREVNNPVAVL